MHIARPHTMDNHNTIPSQLGPATTIPAPLHSSFGPAEGRRDAGVISGMWVKLALVALLAISVLYAFA